MAWDGGAGQSGQAEAPRPRELLGLHRARDSASGSRAHVIPRPGRGLGGTRVDLGGAGQGRTQVDLGGPGALEPQRRYMGGPGMDLGGPWPVSEQDQEAPSSPRRGLGGIQADPGEGARTAGPGRHREGRAPRDSQRTSAEGGPGTTWKAGHDTASGAAGTRGRRWEGGTLAPLLCRRGDESWFNEPASAWLRGDKLPDEGEDGKVTFPGTGLLRGGGRTPGASRCCAHRRVGVAGSAERAARHPVLSTDSRVRLGPVGTRGRARCAPWEVEGKAVRPPGFLGRGELERRPPEGGISLRSRHVWTLQVQTPPSDFEIGHFFTFGPAPPSSSLPGAESPGGRGPKQAGPRKSGWTDAQTEVFVTALLQRWGLGTVKVVRRRQRPWASLLTEQSPFCNFMSHEKCLKHMKTPCACVAPSLVRVPVAHCFGPRGLYKRRFCAVCRKALEAPALRCEVCELHVHPDCVPFACSDCRLCHQDGHQDHDTYHHHWREGSLPSGARCDVCRKTCGSSEVLAGLRCEWCGLQVHSVCSSALPPECSFGRLRSMVLPPACVRLVSRNFSKMHCFRISESVVPEPGEGDDSVDGSAVVGPGREALASPESGKQTLKIFDGDDSIRRNCFRLITVPRLARSEEVLEMALRAYYVSEDPRDFELQALPLPAQTGESGAQGKAWSGGAAGDDSGRGPGSREPVSEAWVIRALPRTQEVLRIYPAWLKVGVACVSLRVTPQSTVRTVVLEVLPLLGRQAESPESFQLVEVLMGSRQVQRTVLVEDEPLLDRLRNIQQTSLRQMSQTRFYVVESRSVVPRVSLFVGGLPSGLAPQEYGPLLQEAVGTKADVVAVSHVYPSQGALVLDVTCFAEAERLYMLVKDTAVQGRPLTALVLPDVLHAKLPPDCCPLLVFVNPKSGGLKGRDLLYSFRKLLNPHQVFELTNGGPLPGFHTFSRAPRFRVLVCGGDGTVGWVLGALEETRHRLACPQPSVAILPLGTGNDLGRVLRWGAGYSGEDPFSVLVSVDEADAVLMDRWTILLDAHEASGSENSVADVEPPKIVQMNNYCGIGIDAELSLDFHQAREEEPGKFTSRFHNKGVYVRVGLQKMSHSRSLHKEIRLQVGQHEVELPSIEGLIFINIPSWGSGADLWGSDNDSRFEKPRIDDGLLEVVGVTGVVHMGQVQGGLRSGIRIAQGSYFRVTLLKATPVQVDGEPWVQAPGHMIISAAGPKVHMLKKSKQKPRKAGGGPKEARVDVTPAPAGDAK
ncbi:diacylglycerol kinase theta [Orycteropus afer afer]|uniref:Diacylglycerol kinase n=1 Tax=Orycteropus afer afer TaxID=1230840 RepID=A0A8B7B2J9_ORYAF|nr:diacylglycerol kinase theta [Orycteropus afer afer]